MACHCYMFRQCMTSASVGDSYRCQAQYDKLADAITNKENAQLAAVITYLYNTCINTGVYWDHFVCLSVALSVSDHVCSVSPGLLNHFIFVTKLDMMVYYHEAMCHAEKLVHCLQCQGHSEGLYNQNITILLYLLKCWSLCN